MSNHSVIVREGAVLGESIAEMFRLLGLVDLQRKNVFVKPNMLRPALPEECAVTSPRLVSETVAYLAAAGAEVMVGDNPVPGNRSRYEDDIAEYCGFLDAAGNRWRNIGKYSIKIKRPRNLLKEFYASREVIDCDLLVSLPKYKSHELTTLSLSIKNHFGIIPGGYKPYIHAMFPRIEDFSEILVEIYETRPADMIIVDCLDVVDAKGRKHHPGIVIGGDNGHAVDYVCALMAGIDPLRIPTVKFARDSGLFDPEKVQINGTLPRIRGFGLPIAFPFRNSVVEFVAQILYRMWLARVPVINPALCTRCLSCENVCPPRAIKGHYIDYNKCIECYCCLEVCPKRAVTTRFRLA
jgi:uncharacterized protein (DUF362 family)/Pyruvate/2-oxoacid:ferredoxin oxidoreductase delta subunit